MKPEDFERRVFEKLDRTDDRVIDLCERTSKLEEKVENHLEVSKQNSISKRTKIYFALSLIGSYAVGVITKITNG